MAESIGRASVFLASGTIVSRILGFVKLIVLARVIGLTGEGADAFALANQLPNTAYVIIAGGVLTATFVPLIVRSALHSDGGTAYINKLVTIALVILAGATIVVTLFAPVVTFLSGGANLPNPGQLDLAVALAYWCLPQIFFYGLYTVFGEVLNARKVFGPTTWVPVLNNVVAIAGLVVFALMFGADPAGARSSGAYSAAMIAVLAGSATLGVAIQAVSLYFFWRRIGLSYRPDFRWRGMGMGETGRLASWTFAMLLVTSIAGFVQTWVAGLASGEYASIAVLQTAWLIFMLPHSVITVSIGTAYFTRMSEHAAHSRFASMRSDISAAIRSTDLLIVLAAAVIGVCAYPFAAVFLKGGDFSQIQATGNVIVAFIIGLVAFCLLFVIQRAFFALGDTRTPFFFTLLQVVITITGFLLCAAFVPLQWLALGIAIVITIAGFVETVVAGLLLRKRLNGIDGRRITASLARYVIAVIIPIAAGVLILIGLGGTTQGGFAISGIVPAIISMVVIGAAMAALYLGGLAVLRSSELTAVASPILARLRRR